MLLKINDYQDIYEPRFYLVNSEDIEVVRSDDTYDYNVDPLYNAHIQLKSNQVIVIHSRNKAYRERLLQTIKQYMSPTECLEIKDEEVAE